MREILFRGKRKDNGEWINGYYVKMYDNKHDIYIHCIYTGFAEVDCDEYFPDWFEIDPTTLGQSIGLTDKNGKDIFTGDIVLNTEGVPYECAFIEKYARFAFKRKGVVFGWFNPSFGEVIGNIHDSPELLKGAN